MFRFEGQSLGYGAGPVLRELRLHIGRGEKVALLGQSGSGKSTLLAQLRAQREPDCAWCPQRPSLVPQLSAYHNIYAGGLQRLGLWRNLLNLLRADRGALAAITPLAAQLGIDGLLWQKGGALSGGQQQRVSLARAAFQQRPVLLADEPVAGLDEQQGRAALAWLMARHESCVLALHQPQLALDLCDRVIGLAGGEIQLDRPAAALRLADLDALYR